jgi:hypothetical protein
MLSPRQAIRTSHVLIVRVLCAASLHLFIVNSAWATSLGATVFASISTGGSDTKTADPADFIKLTASETLGASAAFAQVQIGAGWVGGSQLKGSAESHGRVDVTSEVNWRDSITVLGANQGDDAKFDVHVIFEGTSTGQFVHGGSALGQLEYSVGSGVGSFTFQPRVTAPGPFRFEKVGSWTTKVGAKDQPFLLSLFLDATGGPGDIALIDATDTVQFFLDPVTPGVSYLTASGASYLTPTDTTSTPEPAALLLTGSGLLAAAFARRWGNGRTTLPQ